MSTAIYVLIEWLPDHGQRDLIGYFTSIEAADSEAKRRNWLSYKDDLKKYVGTGITPISPDEHNSPRYSVEAVKSLE